MNPFLFTVAMCCLTGACLTYLNRQSEARIVTRMNAEKKKEIARQRKCISKVFQCGVKVGQAATVREMEGFQHPRRRELTAFLAVDAITSRKHSN